MAGELSKLFHENKELFKQKVEQWLKDGKSLKGLAIALDVPYPTLHRLVRTLGIDGKSVCAAIPDEDWSDHSKYQLAKKWGLSYGHLYNYYRYHKDEIDDRIRRCRQARHN